MANRKLQAANRQRGQALIMVLIALALGSLLIYPTLGYVYTGLVDTRISKEQLLDQYTADAAIEYALWQLKYNVDNITGQLNPEDPSVDTTITVNGMDIPITTAITLSLLGDDWPFPIPSSQSGIHLTTALVIAPPFFSEDGEIAYFTHSIYMFNSGDSAAHMKTVFQRLDPRLAYVQGYYNGYEADLTETYVDDHWELYFDFEQPLPKLNAQQATFISFVASTNEEVDENPYVGSGWVSYAAFEADEGGFFIGEYEPGSIGCRYDITVTVGSYTILVNVGITDEGEIVVLSYQIQ